MRGERAIDGRPTPNGPITGRMYREPRGWRSGLFSITVGLAIAAATLTYYTGSFRATWVALGLHFVVLGIAESLPSDRQLSASLLRVWAYGFISGILLLDVVLVFGT